MGLASLVFLFILFLCSLAERICHSCFRRQDKLQRCGQCKFAHYCDRTCQRAGWAEHKQECGAIKAYGKAPNENIRLVARIMWRLDKDGSVVSDMQLTTLDELEDHIADMQEDELKDFKVDIHNFLDYWPRNSKQHTLDVISHIFGVKFEEMSDSTKAKTLGRCICIITGASKGFGWAMAHQVSLYLKPGSVLLLVARTGTLLQELKKELQSFTEDQSLVVHCIATDLSTQDGVNETVRVVRQESLNETDHVLLINNAASLGDISQFASFTNLDQVNSYLSFNVSSAVTLTAGILQVFPLRAGLRWSVVNISSVFAVEARSSWMLYCTAKSARAMMFRVLAEEEPNVKVLSYSPGPMDTEMQEEIIRLTGIRYHLFPCKESAAKLMKVLLENKFTSGSHLDFFKV